ncbi:alpha,alpha-trehalose-phosphate synthase (UDP-forming) [Alterisphingorhabdus coralli]|uniref:Trehalose-6-phosphate synthase n=1 Tax=Alterisphingorhabdus coralli TaxID=3071408 RepID=A0AA97I0Y3_9SPHN|nr:trehalose-6-phosphate synthase [Parasphingorhabdus sp. SCSIO 66989]WOE75482.1 trehalose-6-phosphate synthase [Parasphingorhabdus sp. SCSIO 66989]
MSRLVVISNRVSKWKQGGAQGGLAVALNSALRQNNGLWFGWSGQRVETFTGHLDIEEHGGVRTATIDLDEQDVDEYYNGFANRTLWPLFHYRIDLAEYERSFGEGYERVNNRFADTVLPLIEPGDAVWVHDYHLIPLGYRLRKLGCNNKVGFFLHTPWPPTRLLVALPYHQRLVESLFAYDVVGFQTEEWLESFRHYCEKELGANIDGETISYGDLTLKAIACPIGLDHTEFLAASQSEDADKAHDKMRASLQDRKLIVGVDRLDYSKGLEERFNGLERFFTDNPEQQREVVMVQIAPPSRGEVESYQEIRAALDAQTGRINGAFAHVDWTPIRYANRGYPRVELAGIYRAAKAALVTPLRDGMNLVAKEFVVAQDPEDPGVLILSRFAGASLQLTEALLVNPYSAEELSDAISTALAMPLEERQRRWRAMMDVMEKTDVIWWREKFTQYLR